LRTYGMLLALFLPLVRADILSSGAYPYQDSASIASDVASHILLTVADNAGNSVPAPARECVQLRIGGQPVEIGEIRPLKGFFLVFLGSGGCQWVI
jgi:hypothetical protein